VDIGTASARDEHVAMKTQFRKPSRSVAGARRLERSYDCASCGAQHRSVTRMRSCPECGERLAVAVIRRAKLAGV
jgi:DNA-directed RNA polymerase subunit RPC12/RpoP